MRGSSKHYKTRVISRL